jgi:hypothetical protein
LTGRRRRLTARGIQPVGLIPHVFAWFSVDGAVAPTTGEPFFLELPSRNADPCQFVGDACAQAFPASLNILLLENRGAHTAQPMRWPEHVRYVWLPPYGPELNPMARGWRNRKDARAWRQFTTLDAPQDAMSDLLQAYEASPLPSLTSSTYLVEAIHALCA